jgi:hypothetical protein
MSDSANTPGSRDSDPLLRAVARGDEHCPDGRALARLGALLRSPAPTADLRARVEARLATAAASAPSEALEDDADDAAAIDAHVAGTAPSAGLAGLGALITSVRAAPVDLRPRVRRQLMASARLSPISSETPVSTRAQAESAAQAGRRLRIILGAVALHAAAILVVVLWAVPTRATQSNEEGSAWVGAKPVARVPEHLPHDWNSLGSAGFDLVALRRSPELRAAARRQFNGEPATGAVACGLRWLQQQQQADGRFGPQAETPDVALATQALATLALLAEGTGTSMADHQRQDAITRALPRLSVDDSTGAIPRSLAALAQVEAALLGLAPQAHAETALADLGAHLPSAPGAAGLGGFALLAVESARQGGYAIPPRLSDEVRLSLGRQLPPLTGTGVDCGRVGLAAFARLVLGYRDNPSTATLLTSLDTVRPSATSGDALGWFFATLALREAGGPAWDGWMAALQGRLVPAFSDVGPGLAMVPATAVHHAPNDIFATAIALLDLQVPYRYLPTAP